MLFFRIAYTLFIKRGTSGFTWYIFGLFWLTIYAFPVAYIPVDKYTLDILYIIINAFFFSFSGPNDSILRRKLFLIKFCT